jgi:hypothetical protein
MVQISTGDKTQMLTVPRLIALKLLPARATRRLIDEGKVPCVKIGSRRYINLTVFLQYLENGEA